MTQAVGTRARSGTATPAGVGDSLRLGAGRVRLWAVGLIAVGLLPVISTPLNAWNDWGAFWSAGGTVGGPDLALDRPPPSLTLIGPAFSDDLLVELV